MNKSKSKEEQWRQQIEQLSEGALKQGKGTMKLGSGAFEGPYSFSSRLEEAKGPDSES